MVSYIIKRNVYVFYKLRHVYVFVCLAKGSRTA